MCYCRYEKKTFDGKSTPGKLINYKVNFIKINKNYYKIYWCTIDRPVRTGDIYEVICDTVQLKIEFLAVKNDWNNSRQKIFKKLKPPKNRLICVRNDFYMPDTNNHPIAHNSLELGRKTLLSIWKTWKVKKPCIWNKNKNNVWNLFQLFFS